MCGSSLQCGLYIFPNLYLLVIILPEIGQFVGNIDVSYKLRLHVSPSSQWFFSHHASLVNFFRRNSLLLNSLTTCMKLTFRYECGPFATSLGSLWGRSCDSACLICHKHVKLTAGDALILANHSNSAMDVRQETVSEKRSKLLLSQLTAFLKVLLTRK